MIPKVGNLFGQSAAHWRHMNISIDMKYVGEIAWIDGVRDQQEEESSVMSPVYRGVMMHPWRPRYVTLWCYESDVVLTKIENQSSWLQQHWSVPLSLKL